MSDPATLDFYSRRAEHYVDSLKGYTHRHLDPFLDRLAPGAAILELGCGGGRDSAYMIERGFILDATDGVPAMAEQANLHFGVGARVMRFEELDALARYDAVWAHACLLHASRAELPQFLAAIHRALRPGGWHFANYKLGDGEGRDLLGRLHNFPDPRWLESRYREAGFAIEETEIYPGKASDGTQRDWMALTVRKDPA